VAIAEKALISSPGLPGTVPSFDPQQFARSWVTDGTIKFGRAMMRSGGKAVVFSGSGGQLIGVSALSKAASGVNTTDSVTGTTGEYEAEDMAGAIEQGFATAYVEEAVDPSSPVRVRRAAEPATAGYQAITFSTAIVGTAVPEVDSDTYDLDVTPDGGSTEAISFAVTNTDDWDTIAAAIQVALRTATGGSEVVAVVDGAIRFTSGTTGSSSTMLVAAGTAGSSGGDLLAAIATLSSTGSQAISSAPTSFVGATVPAMATESYDLDIAVDTTARNQVTVAIDITNDWNAIAAALQVATRAETGGTETVVVSGGQIVLTSGNQGTGSSVRVSAGTAGSGGGDLLAAIDALPNYGTTVEDPEDGMITATGVSVDTAVDGLDNPLPKKEPGNFATGAIAGRTALVVGAQYRGRTAGPGAVALLLTQPLSTTDD
jgi:hypothetical protein